MTHAKPFLAGKNQVAAIKNWLVNAGVIESSHGRAEVTEMGRLMAAKDDRAEKAWTWWLFHLHLCSNSESYPYSTFFTATDSDGNGWMTEDDVLDRLAARFQEAGIAVEKTTIETYFQGVMQSYRPGGPLHDLQLIEYRKVDQDRRDRFAAAQHLPRKSSWPMAPCYSSRHSSLTALLSRHGCSWTKGWRARWE